MLTYYVHEAAEVRCVLMHGRGRERRAFELCESVCVCDSDGRTRCTLLSSHDRSWACTTRGARRPATGGRGSQSACCARRWPACWRGSGGSPRPPCHRRRRLAGRGPRRPSSRGGGARRARGAERGPCGGRPTAQCERGRRRGRERRRRSSSSSSSSSTTRRRGRHWHHCRRQGRGARRGKPRGSPRGHRDEGSTESGWLYVNAACNKHT